MMDEKRLHEIETRARKSHVIELIDEVRALRDVLNEYRDKASVAVVVLGRYRDGSGTPLENSVIAGQLIETFQNLEKSIALSPPMYKHGARVVVDHPRYKGEGHVAYNKPRVVGVLLGNGNTWEYEAETVRPCTRKTIQQLIDETPPGGELIVPPAEYDVKEIIVINKPMNVNADGASFRCARSLKASPPIDNCGHEVHWQGGFFFS